MWQIADYDFTLPQELIAQKPLDNRDDSKLLVVGDSAPDRLARELPALLPDDAVVVLNDTKVVPVRLHARKKTGGVVEIFVLRPHAAGPEYPCLIRGARKLKQGDELTVGSATVTIVQLPKDGVGQLHFDGSIIELLDAHGAVPLPPYISRNDGPTAADQVRYQSVFADKPGAVAAPTASLHITESMLDEMASRGISIARLTLHVGLGTFQPIRTEDIREHALHSEWIDIPEETAALVAGDRPVVAVGTTVMRALEGAAALGDGRVLAGPRETDIYIKPGFQFQVVDTLLTNFHLPRSSLLILVSAFGGRESVLAAYRHAIDKRYRFYSYGDAMLVQRKRT